MRVFKNCTCCETRWITRDDFLSDSQIDLVGYQANFCQLELGYLLFNHLICESTLAIHAGVFKDLYSGPIFDQRLTGSDICQGFCIDSVALEPCDEKCECAYVREILQIVQNWPKEDRLVRIYSGNRQLQKMA
jgi:hypothetical protein